MCDISSIDQKSIDDGKVWVRIRGTNPTVQKPVGEIQYDTMIPAVNLPVQRRKLQTDSGHYQP